MFPSPPLLLAGMLTLLAATPVCAVDLFFFRDAFGRVLAFTVPNTAVIESGKNRGLSGLRLGR